MRIKKFITPIVLCICYSFLASCLTIRPGAVKSGKHLYENFLSGNSGTMYYLKPLEFKGLNTNSSMSIDFTFRYTNVTSDTAHLKFTIFDKDVFKQIDSIKIDNGQRVTTCYTVSHMFSDRANKSYANRFQTETGLADLKKCFEKEHWKFTVYRNGQASIFSPSKKTRKNIVRLRTNVFAVL